MSGQWRKVRTQAELQQALDDQDFAELVGDGHFEVFGSASVRAYDSASVSAYDSASVRAFGSASVSAFGSASVRAFGSASVRASDSASVSAFGSASVRAFGSASVRAFGSASVSATPYVAVHKFSKRVTISGTGHIIEPPDLTDPANWLAYYGIQPDDSGVVLLYKSVHADFRSQYGADYSPGSTPEADDFMATNACGSGLHFSPRPHMALAYHDGPGQRFVACPVRAADLVPIGTAGACDKVKARAVVSPGCFEVDIDGRPLEQQS
jgi:hypothetical protein